MEFVFGIMALAAIGYLLYKDCQMFDENNELKEQLGQLQEDYYRLKIQQISLERAIADHCDTTGCVNPDMDNPKGTISQVINWHMSALELSDAQHLGCNNISVGD